MTFGGRAHFWIGDYVKLGVTGNNDSESDESLVGADVTVRKSSNTWAKLETGRSKGTDLFTSNSTDGGFNYTTTDLATLAYRLQTWHPEEVIYVTDGRQQLHFQQLFAAFRRWHPEARMRLAHVWFGSILGDDGKPLKTRAGENVKLSALLDEAEERALREVSSKNPELPEERRREVARVVGIGAVKYADLLPNRQSDYVFSWDKMLALSGNTAPYLQYAYARIRSIFRKGGLTDLKSEIRNPKSETNSKSEI